MKYNLKSQKLNIYTDIALDLFEKNNKSNNKISLYELDVDKKLSQKIHKKIGKYYTIEFSDINDINIKNKLVKCLLNIYGKLININKDDLVLIIGLGNPNSTPDSLGTLVANKILVTNHLYEINKLDSNYQRVSSICTNVMGETGIETYDIIYGIVKQIKPKVIIVIDSLATSSIDRLNKSIQITDTGIYPGSGVGNKRKELSFKTLKIPIICIGVPTVISLNNLCDDIDSEYSNLIVTPNEVDNLVDSLSNVIVESLDLYFHNI